MPRLLLVDDEATLLQLLQRYLERMGYEVDTASTPAGALSKFQADPTSYDLVLTDLSLPELNGEDMLSRMRALKPGLPAIISSGRPYEPRLAGVAFLQKPFLPKMLAEVLEKVLPGRRTPAPPTR